MPLPLRQYKTNKSHRNYLDERTSDDGPDTYRDEAEDAVPDRPSHNHGQHAAHWHYTHTYCTDERCRHRDNADSILPMDAMSIYSSELETASNRTGAGRGLGQVYSALGSRLERSIGQLAHKMGFGPRAAAETVLMCYFEWYCAVLYNKCDVVWRWGNICRSLRGLLKYLSYASKSVHICLSQ